VARAHSDHALSKCEAGAAHEATARRTQQPQSARSNGEAFVATARCTQQRRGGQMSFMNSNSLDELAKRLAESVPESLRAFGRDLEGNFKAVLQAQLAKLDLVTRQDFDVQAAILERTQAKLTDLEARLKDLETKL
jgi:ubiquinone biosynthesis accessory factor UbiK